MNNIEQEFFEAFGIEHKYQDRCALEDRCLEQCLPWSEVEKRCPHKMNCTDDCVDAYDFAVYPPITPEIVLGLITILVKKHCNLTLYWDLPKLTEQILKQCIKDSKDKEIQDQVKELFNEK